MRYTDLDPQARYRIKIIYTGEHDYHGEVLVRFEAEGKEIHAFMPKPNPIQPVEFDIPKNLTDDGILELKWFTNSERTGAGRGCQVGEVWLMRK